jgi:hypothetical protein
MKQQPTPFGQVRQLAEARQQVAELQLQRAKLIADIKNLRDMDRAIFDEQDHAIGVLQTLARDHQRLLAQMPRISVWSASYADVANWNQRKDALEQRAQQLLNTKEQ